ncbi:MAG TPA: hypothetical protein VGQ76_02820 [Thermoanaerobaculia bacterium]|nr:hypothetical protein [Thermoanaerobaculia bacterium]
MKNLARVLLVVAFALSAFAQDAPIAGVYHEASCPSVDTKRMPRMKRTVAESSGWLPAPDCHPEVRVRFLGRVGNVPTSNVPTTEPCQMVHVNGHWKAGTWVDEYWRRDCNN